MVFRVPTYVVGGSKDMVFGGNRFLGFHNYVAKTLLVLSRESRGSE